MYSNKYSKFINFKNNIIYLFSSIITITKELRRI